MFSRKTDVIQARRTHVQTLRKPEVGTLLHGLRNMPVRVHLQVARGTESDIFAYATLVPLNPELTTTNEQWFLRDYASQELVGTKVILSQKARDGLLRRYDNHPVLNECDVLPVNSLKVVRMAASGKSLEADIATHVSAVMLELCAHFATAAMACNGDAECLSKIQEDFYAAVQDEAGAGAPREAVS